MLVLYVLIAIVRILYLLFQGNVRSLAQLTIPRVTVDEQLSIDKQGSVLLQGKVSSVLAVDPHGIIVTVPHTRTEAQLDGSGQLSYDSYFSRVEAEHVDVAVQVHAKRVVADELFIEMMDEDRDESMDRDRSGDGVKHIVSGNILVARQVTD